MAGFDVDPDGLRDAARTVDGIVRTTTSTAATPAMPDAGHVGLADAMTAFGAATTSSWTDRLDATGAVAVDLRRTAATYQSADDSGVADLTTRRAVAS